MYVRTTARWAKGQICFLQILPEPVDTSFERPFLARLDLGVALDTIACEHAEVRLACAVTHHIATNCKAVNASVEVSQAKSGLEVLEKLLGFLLLVASELVVDLGGVDQKRNRGARRVFLFPS